jgi:uncharacterized protein YdeI (YjbR/CyaY-like superfamily)
VKTAGFNSKVDAYIAKSQPFAQPILSHIRELAHKACPEVEEAIKWSMPFFQLRGIVLGHMAAFKQHCSISFWGPEMNAILNKAGLHSEDGMGSLGKITSLKDLPSDKEMLGYYRHAAELILTGQRTKSLERPKKAPKAAPEVPAELAASLKKNKAAAKIFAEFSPSCKREYIDWIVEAKRPETKEKRVTQAVEWIADGKQRNWKYQNC